MANYQLLKADIDAKVYQNGAQEITGANLNSVLNEMVTTLGAEYQFAGVATIDTNPGTPDAKVFYIANGKGTYTNFGGLEVTEDEVVVLYWDTAWHKVSTGIASQAKLSELELEVYGTLIRKKLANLPYGVSENVLSFVAKANVEYTYSFSIYEALSNTSTLEAYNKNGERVGIVAISSGDTISNVKTLKVESDTELTFNIYYPSTNGKDVLINISANDGIVKDIKVLNNKIENLNEGKADLSLLNSVVAQDNFNIFGYNKEVLLPIEYGTNNINFYKLLPHVDYTIYITRGDEELEQQVHIKLNNAKDNSLLASLNLTENSKKSASVHIYTEEPINTYFETYLSSGKVNAVVHIDVVPIDVKSLTAAYKAKGIYPVPRKINSENFATKSEFVRVMNTLFTQYVDVAKCHISSFYRLFERDSWEEIQEKCNHNFRKDVVDFSAPVEYNVDSINSALSERIYRFSDATLNTGWRECSINTGIQGDEPSVIISEDRKYMYVYARKYADFHYRWKTLDGVNYELSYPS